MTGDYLEEEFREPYAAWKANQTPEGNAAILKALQPVIERGVKTHVGDPNALLLSNARQLTLQGLRNYDPTRSRLQTHLFNQYQGLKRINRRQTQPIHIPERVQFGNFALQQHTQELADELGRDPTDAELADKTGFSQKQIDRMRKAQVGISEGGLESVAPGFSPELQQRQSNMNMWHEMVYDDLDLLDKQIMDYTLGLHGKPKLGNLQIAQKLGRSAGAISQRKARIQKALDQEIDLSPFLG